MRKKKNTTAYVLAFLLFAGGLGYLCFTGFSENSVYFLNVAEARGLEPASLGHARLFGTVAETGLERAPDAVFFNLADKENADLLIPVAFRGIIPDAFKVGAEVIVEGGMDDDGHFTARTLMTKCPSKYQKENRGKL